MAGFCENVNETSGFKKTSGNLLTSCVTVIVSGVRVEGAS